tara:strand:+ start:631 stop:966 length:336 start_codon:yes stop_codon:yes gene_type:complete
VAAVSNLFIDKDADFSTTISLTDSNGNVLSLSGYSALAQIRKTYDSSTVAATFSVAITAATGQITLTLTDVQTGSLSQGRYVYDVVITDSSGDKTRVLEGRATVTPSVSRS